MPEVFIRKQKVRPGKTESLRKWIDDLVEEAKSDSQDVHDIWEEESLQTMSLFIEHGEDGGLPRLVS